MSESLRFRFKDIIDEVEEFGALAKGFLYADASQVLAAYVGQLRYLQETARKASFLWAIPPTLPLQTRASWGNHNPTGKGIAVYATIDAVWSIVRIPHSSGKNRPAEFFMMAGDASVRIRIRRKKGADEHRRSNADKELAMWRMELGDTVSPGCHFHVQLRGQTSKPPFPSSIAIPRLPSVAVTPAAAFEFVIAELFQEEWNAHVASKRSAFARWRKLQCEMLSRLLEWQTSEVKLAPASPWTSLKLAKPSATLFTT